MSHTYAIEEDESDKNLKFPRAAFLIVTFQFAIKLASNTLTIGLPLYLVDILNYNDDDATVFYHSFNVFVYTSSIVGGIIADSYLGKFKSIVLFSVTITLAMVLLAATATPPLYLPIRTFTILGLLFAAFGFGAMRPCTIAFGGNQFVLPQQAKQLSLLFVFLSIADNCALISVSLIAPVLRKDLTCFGQITCYSLVFVVPATLSIMAIVMILVTKRFYKIHKPEGNVVVKVTKCVSVQSQRKTSRSLARSSSVLVLLLPLIIFWSCYSAQNTIWIFQASRMNGELWGYVIKPDQIQMTNSISVILMIPIFHSYVYPFLAKFFTINTPLRRITCGCFMTAVAFYVSSVVELNLEPTYAKIPTKGLAQMRIYNTLNCQVSVTVGQQNFLINELDIWQELDIATNVKKVLEYKIDFSNCNISKIISNHVLGQLEVIENQATSWALTENGLEYEFIDHVDKSNSGNPLVRTLIDVKDEYTRKDVSLSLISKGITLEKIKLPDNLTESYFKEVAHKTYDMYLNNQLVEANVPLKVGGVYTILGSFSNSSTNIRTVTVTQPNSLHIFWIVPQQILLAVGEIMVPVLVMEFGYSQAPINLKALLQSFWFFLGVFGNLMIVLITEVQLIERKVYVLILYSILMTISSTVFAILAKFYTYRNPVDSDYTCLTRK